jgi:hypothetical protein
MPLLKRVEIKDERSFRNGMVLNLLLRGTFDDSTLPAAKWESGYQVVDKTQMITDSAMRYIAWNISQESVFF